MKDCLGEGGSALGPAFEAQAAAPEDEVVARIRAILEEQVRPAVAQDGGDIVFAGFRDGIVELYLHGSCSGCPSATATLKYGIEGLLREAIPEVRGVVAL
jgi:Fe-S cluster biogenesis protein NfuA